MSSLSADLELLWTRGLNVAPPWRVAALLVLAVLVVGRLLPWLVRTLGGLVRAAAEPVAGVLLLPEYLVSSWCRNHGRPPLWGTSAYDNGLQRAVGFLQTTLPSLTSSLGRRRKIPWGRVIVVALLPAVIWYGRLYLPDNQGTHWLADSLDNAQQPVLAVDSWISTTSGIPSYKPVPLPRPKPKLPPCQPAGTKAGSKKRT